MSLHVELQLKPLRLPEDAHIGNSHRAYLKNSQRPLILAFAHLNCSVHTNPNEDGLISESVASLRQVLDGHSVRAVAGWVVHVMLLNEEGKDTVEGNQKAKLKVCLAAMLHSQRNGYQQGFK